MIKLTSLGRSVPPRAYLAPELFPTEAAAIHPPSSALGVFEDVLQVSEEKRQLETLPQSCIAPVLLSTFKEISPRSENGEMTKLIIKNKPIGRTDVSFQKLDHIKSVFNSTSNVSFNKFFAQRPEHEVTEVL